MSEIIRELEKDERKEKKKPTPPTSTTLDTLESRIDQLERTIQEINARRNRLSEKKSVYETFGFSKRARDILKECEGYSRSEITTTINRLADLLSKNSKYYKNAGFNGTAEMRALIDTLVTLL